jgi:hypothetical protein
MSQAKRASKGKRPSKAVSVLGIAGASLAASTGGSLADIPVADIPSQNTAPFQFITLGEEEISDVSLATFHLFDKEGLGTPRSGIIQLARGGCGCGHGCGGCGHGAAAVSEASAAADMAAAGAAVEAAAAAGEAAAAAAGAGAKVAAACHGEVAASARLEHLRRV